MEQEFKWTAGADDLDRVLARLTPCGAPVRIEMAARYFDTPDGLLRREKIGLRLRRENGVSVCCMKLRGGEDTASGLHAHAEYECPAETLSDGLARLPGRGADPALCARLAVAELTETAFTRFTRLAQPVAGEGFTAELAFDQGSLGAQGGSAPLSEIELEFKSGDPDAFARFGQALTAALGLRPEPRSKLARALDTNPAKK